MLALTRRTGQAILIGDEVRLTVCGRLRDQIWVDVCAPFGSAVDCDGMRIQATPARRGRERFRVAMLSGECLRIGAVRVLVDIGRSRQGQVRLCFEAPRGVAIRRDELDQPPAPAALAA